MLLTTFTNRNHSLKYKSSMKSGGKDIGIQKQKHLKFVVARTQFLFTIFVLTLNKYIRLANFSTYEVLTKFTIIKIDQIGFN